MKKIFTLALLACAAIAMNAKEVTFDFTKPTQLTPAVTPAVVEAGATSGKGVEVLNTVFTSDGVSISFDTLAIGSSVGHTTVFTNKDNTTYELRVYKNNILKVDAASASDKITKITFTGTVGSNIDGVANQTWIGTAAQNIALNKITGTCKIKTITVTLNEEVTPVTIDTITVAEAIQRIADKKNGACVVKGIVKDNPSDPGTYGNTIFWLKDINDAAKEMKAYKISGQNNAKLNSISDITWGQGDTVLIYASAIENYNDTKAGTTYAEINVGYYVKTIGGSQMERVTISGMDVVEAVYIAGEVDNYWEFDIYKDDEEAGFYPDLYLDVKATSATKINGSYNLTGAYAYFSDNDSVEVENNGTVKITYIKDDTETGYPVYSFVGTFTVDNTIYSFNEELIVVAYDDATGDEIILEDGGGVTPVECEEIPAGAITVAQAMEIGDTLVANATTAESYTVYGYVAKVAFQVANGNGSWYMTDEKVDGSGFYNFEAYKCTMNAEVTIGDYVFVTGKITKFVGTKGTTIEISGGAGHFACEQPTGVEEVAASAIELNLNAPMFNMLGVQVDENYKGVVIQNNAKFLR